MSVEQQVGKLQRPQRRGATPKRSLECNCRKAVESRKAVLAIPGKKHGPYPYKIYICTACNDDSQVPKAGRKYTIDDVKEIALMGLLVSEAKARQILDDISKKPDDASATSCPGIHFCEGTAGSADGRALRDILYGFSLCSEPDCKACLVTGSNLIKCRGNCGSLKPTRGPCPNVCQEVEAPVEDAPKRFGSRASTHRSLEDRQTILQSKAYRTSKLYAGLHESLSRIADKTNRPQMAILQGIGSANAAPQVMFVAPFRGVPVQLYVPGSNSLVQPETLPCNASFPSNASAPVLRNTSTRVKFHDRMADAHNFQHRVAHNARPESGDTSGMKHMSLMQDSTRFATDAYVYSLAQQLLHPFYTQWVPREETRVLFDGSGQIVQGATPRTLPQFIQYYRSEDEGRRTWQRATEVKILPDNVNPERQPRWVSKPLFLTLLEDAGYETKGEDEWARAPWPRTIEDDEDQGASASGVPSPPPAPMMSDGTGKRKRGGIDANDRGGKYSRK